jgi:luciferase family oxidoreductase group 1
MRRVPLSVLDVVPVRRGTSVSEAFAESVALAQHAEGLGYSRYWFAEHHGAAGIASTSPAVLSARVASATSTIRVGAGGVMLPNHAALTIAEQFGTLEALFPGRVDLGLGRAPGTDPLTSMALGAKRGARAAEAFPGQLDDLIGFFRGAPAWAERDMANVADERRFFDEIDSTPALGHEVPIWLLGSSDVSARLAGERGLPFSFAHHFSQENTLPALSLYRRVFRPTSMASAPSWSLQAPKAMVAALIIVADNDADAVRNAMPMALSFLRMGQGVRGPFPTLQDVDDHPWEPHEERFIAGWLEKNIVGGPRTVKAKLTSLLSQTAADELMVLSTAPTPEARQRSYTLLRELHDSV